MQKYWYILVVKVVNDLWWNFYGKDVNLGIEVEGMKNDTNFSLSSNYSDAQNRFEADIQMLDNDFDQVALA